MTSRGPIPDAPEGEEDVRTVRRGLSDDDDALCHKKPRLDSEVTAYWQRVATYSHSDRWSAKPDRLSPLTCSRFGWSCFKADVLRCECCKALIACRLPSSARAAEDRAVAAVERKLADAHHKMCHWGWSPLEENCLAVDGSAGDGVALSLAERFSSLREADARESLVTVAVKYEEEFWDANMYERVRDRLGSAADVGTGEECELERKLLWLALTGWRSGRPKADAVRCDRCARTVGLWTFREADRRTFNPLDQHRDWCPWVSRTQGGKERDHPAWRAVANRLVGTLGSSAAEDSPKSALSCARNLMDSWLRRRDQQDGTVDEQRPQKKT